MRVCVLCKFETELDDVDVPIDAERCICIRCVRREATGQTATRVGRRLERDVREGLEP